MLCDPYCASECLLRQLLFLLLIPKQNLVYDPFVDIKFAEEGTPWPALRHCFPGQICRETSLTALDVSVPTACAVAVASFEQRVVNTHASRGNAACRSHAKRRYLPCLCSELGELCSITASILTSRSSKNCTKL